MITLEEYKLELLSIYDNEEEKEKRKEYLNRIFSDRYLERIISDTYDFIKGIYNTKYLEENKSSHLLNLEEAFDEITLDPSTNRCSDKIYIDNENKYISHLIITKTFKEIEIEVEEYKEKGVEDTTIYTLILKNFPTNMLEIKENLFGEAKLLK